MLNNSFIYLWSRKVIFIYELTDEKNKETKRIRNNTFNPNTYR